MLTFDVVCISVKSRSSAAEDRSPRTRQLWRVYVDSKKVGTTAFVCYLHMKASFLELSQHRRL